MPYLSLEIENTMISSYSGGGSSSEGDGDVLVGAGPGAPGGHVKVFAYHVSELPRPGDDGDVLVGAGPGAPGGHVKCFDGYSGSDVPNDDGSEPSSAPPFGQPVTFTATVSNSEPVTHAGWGPWEDNPSLSEDLGIAWVSGDGGTRGSRKYMTVALIHNLTGVNGLYGDHDDGWCMGTEGDSLLPGERSRPLRSSRLISRPALRPRAEPDCAPPASLRRGFLRPSSPLGFSLHGQALAEQSTFLFRSADNIVRRGGLHRPRL